MKIYNFRILLKVFIIFLSYTSFGAQAALLKVKKNEKPIEAAFVVDGDTGKILYNKNGYKKVYPASLTKLMTVYLTLERIKNNKLKLNDKFTASANAIKMQPSKLGLKQGEQISVFDAINALIIKSANDVAVTVAEGIAGNEEKFAKMMTNKARILGMKRTLFKNASGWHNSRQKSTAADMVKLSMALKRDFPEYMHWFSKNSFTYKGKKINGHNNVTQNYAGAEGMKTGYTKPSGYNLVTSATRDGKNLFGVVIGSKSAIVRDEKMTTLLDKYFNRYKKRTDVFFAAGKVHNINSNKTNKSKVNNKLTQLGKIKPLTPTAKLKQYGKIRKINKNNRIASNKIAKKAS